MKKWISLLLVLLLLTGCGLTKTPANTQAPSATQVPEQAQSLTVHLVDVGQADCILLECGGKFMLIDGGNVSDSSLVVSYLQKQGVETLETVVCTHAHEDHVGGLPGVLAVFPAKQVLAPTKTYDSKCFNDFLYYVDQQRLEVQIPTPGQQFSLGSARITVLGPVKSYAETNDTSIVLMVEYGDHSFLFTGDMETTAENDMLDYWEGKNVDWNVDVLKVGHHGSNTSTGYRFLYETAPEYGLISVGVDNSYGHPHEEPMSRLQDAQVEVYRTDTLGTVLVTSDGQTLAFSWEKSAAAPETPDGETCYIGNVKSKALHLPSCGNLPKEENRVEFESYEEALEAGYHPCSNCMG